MLRILSHVNVLLAICLAQHGVVRQNEPGGQPIPDGVPKEGPPMREQEAKIKPAEPPTKPEGTPSPVDESPRGDTPAIPEGSPSGGPVLIKPEDDVTKSQAANEATVASKDHNVSKAESPPPVAGLGKPESSKPPKKKLPGPPKGAPIETFFKDKSSLVSLTKKMFSILARLNTLLATGLAQNATVGQKKPGGQPATDAAPEEGPLVVQPETKVKPAEPPVEQEETPSSVEGSPRGNIPAMSEGSSPGGEVLAKPEGNETRSQAPTEPAVGPKDHHGPKAETPPSVSEVGKPGLSKEAPEKDRQVPPKKISIGKFIMEKLKQFRDLFRFRRSPVAFEHYRRRHIAPP